MIIPCSLFQNVRYFPKWHLFTEEDDENHLVEGRVSVGRAQHVTLSEGKSGVRTGMEREAFLWRACGEHGVTEHRRKEAAEKVFASHRQHEVQ